MRILIIADKDHESVAIEAAKMVIGEDPGSSITITDEAGSGELIDSNGYEHIVRNPTLETILALIKRGHKLC